MGSVKTPFRIRGDEVGSCNCAWGCPCQFNAEPTHGRCEGLMVAHVTDGHFGTTRLDGVVFAGAYWWPGPIHEGNGFFRLAIDERAAPDQRQAIIEMSSGRHGGTIFEIFAAMCPNVLDPVFVPIELQSDRVRRQANVSIPRLGELLAEPIKNPVTGEEHRAQIRLPDGFEYKEAEVGNTVRMRGIIGDRTFENHNSYAQFNEFDWTNA
jgi:hypothetical protein